MANLTLTAMPPLGGFDQQMGENRLTEQHHLALVTVAWSPDQTDALVAGLREGWALDLPEPTQTTAAGDWRAISMTPDQILLMCAGDGMTVAQQVTAQLDRAGYVTHQTDAWVCLEISGPETLAALERICPLNLSEIAFPIGASGRTVMEHLGTLVVRLGTTRFLLCSASSSAQSFAHAIETSYRNVMGDQSV